jgi:hypothetical protein
VYGTAILNGTINARANGTTAGAGGDVTTSCGTAPQTSRNDYNIGCPATRDYGGGGGGGRAVAGGTGNGGGDLTKETSTGGAQNGSTTAKPLVGGCTGALGGGAGGAGGGGVQISAAGALSGTGSIETNGSAGTAGAASNGGGGGGSAGDIVLEGPTVSMGTLSANGGAGGTGGAGAATNTGGTGGSGATNNGTTQSTSGIDGNGPTNGNVGDFCNLGGGGGGGGGYGYVVQNQYPCETSLTHAPIANTTLTACLCTNNADCASGLCGYVTSGANANNGGSACGSSTNCSGGTTNLDTANCAPLEPTGSTFTCSDGATPNTTHTACLCTNDTQCASGHCGYVTTGTNANSTGCGSATTCTGGTTGLDHANCAVLEPTTPTSYSCTDGSIANTTHTACLCTNNSQCASGFCGYVTTGANANSTACGSTTNCSGGNTGLDTADCAPIDPSTPTSYSCSTGTPNTTNTACICTNNSQCASGQCGYVTTGMNANSGACGSSTNCSGGSTGLDTANCAPIVSSTSASAYCSTTLTPAPAAGGGACLCTADSDCGSGHCSNAGGQCPAGNTCSGTLTAGTYDAADCQDGPLSGATGVSTYACATGACESGGASAACTASTPCWCTNNTQCTSGHCESWGGCLAGSCTTSTAATDGFHCILEAPGIPATPTPAVYSCPAIGGNGAGACEATGSSATCASGTECWCTSNAQCPQSGQCLDWNGCGGGTGTSSTECVASAGTNGTDDYHCVLASPGIPTAPTVNAVSSCTTGFCSATTSGDVCWCTSDAQCGSAGLCIPWSGCTSGPCTGSTGAIPNDFHCQEPGAIPPAACTATTAYSCAVGQCDVATTTCLCTADAECPSGECVNHGQCASGACSGTGSSDLAYCVPANITNCASNSDCGGIAGTSIEQCEGAGGTGAGLGQCHCSATTNCGPGLTCTGGVCIGCTKSAQCKDLAHPATCTGQSNAVNGNCCNQADPAVGDAAVTASCGLNATYFPEACLQSTMSAQEKALEFMFFDLTSCVTPDVPPVLSLNLKPETFTLDFESACPSGTTAKWRQLYYTDTFPSPDNGAAISISAQTGPLPADGGALNAASLLPATPLSLVMNQETTGSYIILLDTTVGGLFPMATPPLVSQGWLRLTITMDPTADGNQSPTLNSWNVLYDCPASE